MLTLELPQSCKPSAWDAILLQGRPNVLRIVGSNEYLMGFCQRDVSNIIINARAMLWSHVSFAINWTVNSLWPSDTQYSLSTLGQVMPWCLMAQVSWKKKISFSLDIKKSYGCLLFLVGLFFSGFSWVHTKNFHLDVISNLLFYDLTYV